jgi:hypothetical protein
MDEIMNKRPSLQFYPNDWIGDTELSMCSAVTRGIWITALCRMWHAKLCGSLSGTRAQMCRILACTDDEFTEFEIEIKQTNFGNLTVANKILTLTNRRLVKDEKVRKANAERQKRHYDKKQQPTNEEPNEKVTAPSSTSSSSSTSNKEKTSKKENSFFDIFWLAYPKKQGKGAARKSFKKLNPSKALFKKILTAIKQQKKSDQWLKEDGQYIPNPATWLNQERWGDELNYKETTAEKVARLKLEGRL